MVPITTDKNFRNKNKRVKVFFYAIGFTAFRQPFKAHSQYHQLVDPLIGSEGLGNVFIGSSCPYGMVKP